MDAFKGVFKLQQDLYTKFNLYLKRLFNLHLSLSYQTWMKPVQWQPALDWNWIN